MKSYDFSQDLPGEIDRVRSFFADVGNLRAISPRIPRMEVPTHATELRPGATFPLKLRLGPFAIRWLSIIEEVNPDGSFVDTFTGGPFRSWRHRHSFAPVPGGTRVSDQVRCEPAWWFRPWTGLFVRMLFLYRFRALRKVSW